MAKKAKYIFVSGGVMSAVGKGVTSASISLLLKAHGYTVCPIKCENNLNVDFGTINPIEHGDPFLCFDGAEADIDLGNYERFLSQEVGYKNFMTMGQLYSTVISNERQMKYEGEDVEPIPHVVNEIIRRIKTTAEESRADFVVIELGGTVGEYENNNGLYYEAARILSVTEQVANVHVTYVPVPPHINEPKTKPAQFGLKALMSMGINPNFIVIRSEKPVDAQRKYKFGQKFYIDHRDIFSCENLKNIYQVPNHLYKQNLDTRLLKYFRIKPQKTNLDLTFWDKYSNKLITKFDKKVAIAIVGKYFATGDSSLIDSYYALIEAIQHARIFNKQNVEFKFINSETQESDIESELKDIDGIIVPIGWGKRGTNGKIKAIKYARENKIPFLGLGYGMQLACIEYARSILKLPDANSEEIDSKTTNPIIHRIPFNKKYQVMKGDSRSMRVGTFDCIVKENTLTHQIYNKHNFFKDKKQSLIQERHRHSFELNNKYRTQLEKSGFIFSGTSPDNFLVEFIELPQEQHPFFIATQSHPEYKSSPQKPHPIFIEFLNTANNKL